MKNILLFLGTILVISCQNKPVDETSKLIAETNRFIDSMEIARMSDSIMKASLRNALFDTAGLYLAPVKVLSAKLVSREYSNRKDIRLSWQNVSNKKIDAIKFKWYGLDAFNEPADMGTASIVEGFGGGFTDRSISPGKKDAGTWEIMSGNGKKVVLAWPYEVAFADGTKWKIGQRLAP